MAGEVNPYSQAREPRKRRARDESESPRPASKRVSTGREETRDPRRSRSPRPRSRDRGGQASRSEPRPRSQGRRDPSQSRKEIDPPQGRDPPQSDRGPASTDNGGPPRKRRRPGPSGGISKAQREAHQREVEAREAERKKREDDWAAQQTQTGIHDAVREHYNMVPQRGREWRRTESKIKGLREFNNWVKSVMIQKFSPSLDNASGEQSGHNSLLVLDVGCGKGGDLFKWQKAPQRVGLYVGIDPADVSIKQAQERYQDARRKSRGRIFDAHFVAMDGYGKWLGEVPIIREVGIDPNVGPGSQGRWGGGGFDVVTMMFCLHYSFESEEKARGMLKNVAGALKKGGRLLGVMPSSDVIRSGLERFYKDWDKRWAAKKKAEADRAEQGGKAHDGEKENGNVESQTGEAPGSPAFAPDSPGFVPGSPAFVPDSPTFIPDSPPGVDAADAAEKTNGSDNQADVIPAGDVSEHPEPTWGNSLYRIRFPPKTPRNGVFRPMFGWKYQFNLEEAVEEVPEYIVPFEGFRALAEEYNLELTYTKPFMDIFDENRDDPELGPLSVRMGVTDRVGGQLRMNPEEQEAVAFYLGFCFVKL